MVKEITFEEICRNVREGKIAPVYVLMGEEPYFIDYIEHLLISCVLDDTERDFNQMIFYGLDSDALHIMNTAYRFPMMAKRQLVIVKEAQELSKIELLSQYMKAPMQSTVFVLCHKYKKIDGRKSLIMEAKKTGVVFDSKKIYDDKMPGFIQSFFKQYGMEIDFKSAQMMTDFVGNNVANLAKEADKLQLVMANRPSKRITPEIIEKNIGISKDYNSFEFIRAIAQKDALRANRIAAFFDKNQKALYELQPLSNLFNYFINLMICFYAKDKTERGIMQTLQLKWSFQATDYMSGLKNYKPMKVFDAIHEIRLADAKTKGFDNASASLGDVYKEMIYKIIH